MRVLLAAMVAVFLSVPSAQARARDGFGTSARCHCDRYFNPHYTERARPSRGRGGYRRY